MRSKQHTSREGAENELSVRALGMYADSRLDKIHCALFRYRQNIPGSRPDLSVTHHAEITIPNDVQARIFRPLHSVQVNPCTSLQVHAVLGRLYVDIFIKFCNNEQLDRRSIDLVGLHIAALGRLPPFESYCQAGHAQSWQKHFTDETGITSVVDFCLFEHGRPLLGMSPVAYAQKFHFTHPSQFRALLEIGELATLTVIPASNSHFHSPTTSHQCGPGNLLVEYVLRYIAMGSYNNYCENVSSTEGHVHQAVVDRFLRTYDYSRMAPDMRISNEMFGHHEAQEFVDECCTIGMSDIDMIATITRITAQNIVKQYQRILQDHFEAGLRVHQLLVFGPGLEHTSVTDYLLTQLSETVITTVMKEDTDLGDDYEPVTNAQLALGAVFGRVLQRDVPQSMQSVQRCVYTVGGNIMFGSGWNEHLEEAIRHTEPDSFTPVRNMNLALWVDYLNHIDGR